MIQQNPALSGIYGPNKMKLRSIYYSVLKRKLRELYRMSTKDISVANETITDDMVEELQIFVRLLTEMGFTLHDSNC